MVQNQLDIISQPLGVSKCDLSSLNQSSLQDNSKLVRAGKAENKQEEENKIKREISLDVTGRNFIKPEILATETAIVPSESVQKDFINILTNQQTQLETLKKIMME